MDINWKKLSGRVAWLSLLAFLLAALCFIANFLLYHFHVIGISSDKVVGVGTLLARLGFLGLGALIIRYVVIFIYVTYVWVLMTIFGEKKGLKISRRHA